MDLTKKIELYYGEIPKKIWSGEQYTIRGFPEYRSEESFHAVFVENDVPALMHEQDACTIYQKYGPDTEFSKETGRQAAPFFVKETVFAGFDRPLSLEPRKRPHPTRLAGVSFHRDIAETILDEFTRLGYEIEKKYE